MNGRMTWKRATVVGLAAFYLVSLGFLGGMAAERMRFDVARSEILTRLTEATSRVKGRLMMFERELAREANNN